MLKIFGSKMCPDCRLCKETMDEHKMEYLYFDITENLVYLKEFLTLRDRLEIFNETKEEGKIGIPCLVTDDNEVVFDWLTYIMNHEDDADTPAESQLKQVEDVEEEDDLMKQFQSACSKESVEEMLYRIIREKLEG